MKYGVLTCALATLVGSAEAAPKQSVPSASTWLQSGILTGPSADAPSSIALRHVAQTSGAASGVLARSTQVAASGKLVILEQVHAGIPVRGAKATVRLDSQGRVRWSATRLANLQGVASSPALSMAGAAQKAGIIAIDSHELVVYAPGGLNPRLAYEIIGWEGPLRRMKSIIHADTGRILSRSNLVMTAEEHKANVFLRNPAATPGTSQVTLSSISSGGGTLSAPGINAGVCYDDQDWPCNRLDVTTDADGSFLSRDYADDTGFEDEFSAVNAFYHVAKAREGASFLGIDGLHVDISTNYGTGSPVDNAFYDNDGNLVMGQGTSADFAYDGDVVIHEYGHAIMGYLTPGMTGGYDQLGVNLVPRAINEGYADYLAMVIADSPDLFGYALGSVPNEGPFTAARNMEVHKRSCRDMTGESHEDSLILTSGLWAARESIVSAGLDPSEFDHAVLRAQHAFTGNDGFGDVANLVIAEVNTALGSAAANLLSTALNANGTLSCNRVVPLGSDPHPIVFLGGFDGEPAPLQMSIEVGKDSSDIVLQYTPVVGSGTSDMDILVKKGSPILWDWNTGDSDATWTLRGSAPDGTPATVSLPASMGPGTYYIQFIPDRTYFITDITATGSGVVDPEDPEDPDGEAPGPGPDWEKPPPSSFDEDSGGCSAGGHTSNLGFALLALFLLVGRRRQKQ